MFLKNPPIKQFFRLIGGFLLVHTRHYFTLSFFICRLFGHRLFFFIGNIQIDIYKYTVFV